jgi:hypothetical protein
MQSREPRGDSAAGEADPDVDRSRIFEQTGDAARDDGNHLLALLHYRRAAELRPGDAALEAKISEASAARARSADRKQPSLRSRPRQYGDAAYVASLTAVALAVAAALIVRGRPGSDVGLPAIPLTVAAAAPDTNASAAASAPVTAARVIPSSEATAAVSSDEHGALRQSSRNAGVATRKHANKTSGRRSSTSVALRGSAAGRCDTKRPCACEVARPDPGQRPMGLLQLIFG